MTYASDLIQSHFNEFTALADAGSEAMNLHEELVVPESKGETTKSVSNATSPHNEPANQDIAP